MKYRQIKEMPVADVQAKVTQLRAELIKLNGVAATGTTSKNPSQIKKTKKTIARMLTSLSERKSE